MSDNAVLAALRRMGIAKHEMSGHGFRAAARTILDEVLGFPPHLIEHQLAHAVRDPLGRAYNRTAHLPERRKMMQNSQDTGTIAGNTLPIIIKDLSKIGRPLEKTIIVDNIADNFHLQKDNGIFIRSWYDDPYDTELKDLIPLLKQIVLLQIPDVRKCLKDYRDQMSRMINQGAARGAFK